MQQTHLYLALKRGENYFFSLKRKKYVKHPSKACKESLGDEILVFLDGTLVFIEIGKKIKFSGN